MSEQQDLRIHKHPILGNPPPQIGFSFDFDGRSVPAVPGDTVAAALLTVSIAGFHQHHSGQQRGIFCGIGY